MWMIQIGGGWQSASTDQVRELIERGVIGPHAVVQHEKWRQPGQLGQVQAFAPLFSKGGMDTDPARKQPGAGDSGKHPMPTPEPSWKMTTGGPFGGLESVVGPAILAAGGAGGLLCIIAGIYMIGSGLPAEMDPAAGWRGISAFLPILKTGLGIYFCGTGLGTWATTLARLGGRGPHL